MTTQAQREKFIRDVTPAAEAASRATGIDRDVIIAQAAHESAWGTKAKGNNYFGIKGGGQSFMTTEFINGKPVKMKQGFRTYASPVESFMDWAKLMTSKARYAPVINAATPEAQIAALGKSGYATDPAYASKLGSILTRVKSTIGAIGDVIGFDGQLGIQGGVLGVGRKNSPAAVKSIQAMLQEAGVYDGAVDGIYGPRTEAAVKLAQEAMGVPADGKWGPQTTQAAREIGLLESPANPPGTSLEARDEAYAARQRAIAAQSARLNGLAQAYGAQAPATPQVARNLPTNATSINSMTQALTQRAPSLVNDIARPGGTPVIANNANIDMAARRRISPDVIAAARMQANGLTPEAVQNANQAQAIRAQQARVAAAKAAAAQAAASAATARPQQTVIGNPAGIDMAARRRFTPDQMLNAVETAAARRALAAAPVPRPNPTPVTNKPATPNISDLARAAGARAASAPVPRPNPTLAALPSKTIATPKVAAVSFTPKATTDIPASMRAGYPSAAASKPTASLSIADMTKAVAKPAPTLIRDVRPITAMPKPVTVVAAKPPPAPKPAFTAPQVAAAASTTAAPLTQAQAANAARYAGLAAQYAAQAPVAAVPAPKPVVAPVAVTPPPPVPPTALPPLPPPTVVPKPVVMSPIGSPSSAAKVASGGTFTTSKGVTVQQSDMIGGRYGEASYGRKQSDGSVRGTTQSGAGYTSRVNEKTGRREYSVNGRTYSTDSKGRSTREKVLCTYYMEKGWLPKKIWLQDGKEYKLRPGDQAQIMRLGYHFWAVPTVRFLDRQSVAAKVTERILWPLIKAWSYEAAYRVGYLPKGTVGGKIARAILEPSAFLIGMIITSKRRLLYGG